MISSIIPILALQVVRDPKPPHDWYVDIDSLRVWLQFKGMPQPLFEVATIDLGGERFGKELRATANALREGLPGVPPELRARELDLARVIDGWKPPAIRRQPKYGRQPNDLLLDEFERACGAGSLFELKLRVLADNTPSLKKFAHGGRLEDVEAAVIAEFDAALSAEEKSLLGTTRTLRNKLLHGNFSVAREKLEELGSTGPTGGVWGFSFENPYDVATVADTKTKASSIYGWVLEMGRNGDFTRAVDAFRDAIDIVDRLMLGDAVKLFEPGGPFSGGGA